MFVDVGTGMDGKHRIINIDYIKSMDVMENPDGLLLNMGGGHEIYLNAAQSEKLRQAIADYQQDYHFVQSRAIDPKLLRQLLEEKFG